MQFGMTTIMGQIANWTYVLKGDALDAFRA